jgi:hypothetical protein
VSLVTASVLAAEVDGHADAESAAHGGGSDQSPVAGAVVGGIVLAVDKARDGTTQVTLLTGVLVRLWLEKGLRHRNNLQSQRA